MDLTGAAAAATAMVAAAVPTIGWIRERRRDRATTARAEIGVDLDVLTVARGLLDEQRIIHAQEVVLLRAQLADCLERKKP